MSTVVNFSTTNHVICIHIVSTVSLIVGALCVNRWELKYTTVSFPLIICKIRSFGFHGGVLVDYAGLLVPFSSHREYC